MPQCDMLIVLAKIPAASHPPTIKAPPNNKN